MIFFTKKGSFTTKKAFLDAKTEIQRGRKLENQSMNLSIYRGQNKGKTDIKIKMKLPLLKKPSKFVHFTDFFLRECSMYSHSDFELKK